jgi:hypothetical protein
MGSIEENVWQSMLLLHEQFCDPNRNTVDISRFHDLFLEQLSLLVYCPCVLPLSTTEESTQPQSDQSFIY